jgi:BA14K-like protein
MKRSLALLLTVTSGASLAQTTGTVNPSPAPEPSAKEDVPPGGCMPIGLTASGEIVFPIQCKEIIERERGKAVKQKPTAAEEKPATKQSEGTAPENSNPVIKPVETVTLPKRVEDVPRERAKKSPDDRYCSEHYRSYDPASGTYMGYDGQRRSCR